jgi:CotH kinase protein/Secretion system C-terminal sorting domain
MKHTLTFLFSVLAFTGVIKAQTFTSSNLPIVIINTGGVDIPDEPKITADMGIIFNGTGIRNNITDVQNNYKGKVGIEIRGKSSQQFPMKSYSVELRDATGASISKAILGMPSESDWVLYAPYTDKTLMHNVLAYAISNELGHWAARCRYVEVVLNGSYVGVYVLLEKIKRGASRANIAKLTTADIAGDALTGGYIFKIDKQDTGDEGWPSSIAPNNAFKSQKIQFLYEYPKATAIVQPQKDYIKAYVDSFEFALNGSNFQDPATGFRKFADATSFMDYFFVNEVSRNVDGYRLSSYFYKDKNSKGGKIIAGPVWDYDLGFRNANYCNGSSVGGWSYQFNTVCNEDYWLVPFWWDRLMQDTAYTASLRCRWKQLKQTTLSKQRIYFLIDSVNTLLGEAQQRHFQKWPILGQYVWPNPQPIPTSYAGEISTLKEWVASRLDWMDYNMPNTGACSDWPVNAKGTIIVKVYPNPFVNNLTVSIQSKKDQAVTLQVSNTIGQVVYTKKFTAYTGINTVTDLPVKTWASGVYNFKFTNTDGEKIIERIIHR